MFGKALQCASSTGPEPGPAAWMSRREGRDIDHEEAAQAAFLRLAVLRLAGFFAAEATTFSFGFFDAFLLAFLAGAFFALALTLRAAFFFAAGLAAFFVAFLMDVHPLETLTKMSANRRYDEFG